MEIIIIVCVATLWIAILSKEKKTEMNWNPKDRWFRGGNYKAGTVVVREAELAMDLHLS